MSLSISANIGDSDITSIGNSYIEPLHALRMPKFGEKRTVWERLKEALSESKLPTTQQYAAGLAGVKQPSVSDWNKPGKGPEMDTAIRLAVRLKISVEWLLTERGPKRPVPIDSTAEALWELWPHLDESEKQDILGWARVNKQRKETKPPEIPKGKVRGTLGTGT